MPAAEPFAERDSLMPELDDAEISGVGSQPSGLGATPTPRRRLLGDLLVREGLISPAQLREALRAQAELASQTPLGQILVDQRAITQDQLKRVLDKYNKTYRLGDILVETKTVTEEQLAIALGQQKETGARLGDLLIELNFATELQIKKALCTQLRLTFVDLDTVAIDPGLVPLVGRRYAERRRVLPIAKIGNRLTVAVDDPTDTDVLDELEASTGCRIDVVTSTAAAICRALARAYGHAPAPTPTDELAAPAPAGSPERVELDALRAVHEQLGDEHQASLRALEALAQRHAETERSLAELRATHDALQREHTAAAGTFHDLATRTLAELEAARHALRDERESSAREFRALEERHAQTARALTELKTAHAALVHERDERPDSEAGSVTALEAILRRLRA